MLVLLFTVSFLLTVFSSQASMEMFLYIALGIGTFVVWGYVFVRSIEYLEKSGEKS